MNTPLVSIVLPTYNGAKYIRKSIESCLEQSYRNIELIIVDDCSTDETPSIVQEYAAKDARVRYFRNETNQRLPRSLNVGFAQAKGEFLTWTSDDNFYLPLAIEKMVAHLQVNKGDFVYCDLYIFYYDNINYARLERLPDVKAIEKGNCVRACFLYRRKVLEVVGGYDPDMELLEDYDYWVRVYRKFSILHLAEPLYYYRHHPKSLWTSRNNEIRVAELLFRFKYGFADKKETAWLLSSRSVNLRGGWKLLLKVKARVFLKKKIFDALEDFQDGKASFTQTRLELYKIIHEGVAAAPNNPKHILFLRRMVTGKGWGGLEKLVMEWFARIDYRKCDITVGVNQGCQTSYTQRLAQSSLPVKLVQYSFPFEGNPWIKFWEAFKFFREMKPSTIIFLQGAFTDFSLAHAIAGFLVTGGKVYMHENLGAPASPEKFKKRYFGLVPSLELWWHKILIIKNLRPLFTRKVLVVSQEIKDRLVKLWRYPADKVKVTYHGVDTVHYAPSAQARAEMRRTLGIADADTVIISTARLNPVKRLERLIEAFDQIHTEFPNTWLLMLGGGMMESQLKDLANSKRARGRILFFGLQQEVIAYLQASDIFVLPSDNEGLSLALLEAMATGLICLSTNCTGTSEVITDKKNGYIVEKSVEGVLIGLRTILKLSAQDRQQMVDAGLTFVRSNFEINSRVKDVLKFLDIPCR